MAIVTPTDEAAAILVRVFEALARQSGKTLAAATRADIIRACELLSQAAGGFDELLDDMGDTPRRSPSEQALDPDWRRFERWRAIRRAEADATATAEAR